MTAASPSRAAELSAPVVSTPAPSAEASIGKTLVIRADPRTGKLVRSVVIAPRPADAKPAGAPKTTPVTIQELVERSAKAHNVDPLLVDAVIKVESNFNPSAVSSKGAQGLMQLMPPTARMLGVNNSLDPGENIEAGVKYLKYLQDLYKDDRLALAAYNAGPGAVDKYKWIPPYRETQNYVYQVGKRYGEARKEAASKPAPQATVAAQQTKVETAQDSKPPEPKQPRIESFFDEHGRLHLNTTQQ